MSTHQVNSSSTTMEIGQSNQELIAEKRRGKRRRKMLIGGAITLFVFTLVTTGVILIFTSGAQSASFQSRYPSISLDGVLNGQYSAQDFNGSWVSGNEILYRSVLDEIILYNVDSRISAVLFRIDPSVFVPPYSYDLSPDRKFLLIGHQIQKLFRYSFIARYTLINLETQQTSELTINGEPIIQNAIWSPVGHALVLVSKNNLYYKKDAVANLSQQITQDGLLGNVYNGIPDWVYEEEVLNSNVAVWFSPDGKRLAYLKLVDSEVPVMTFPVYGEPGILEFQYTKALQLRYPKAGTKNPKVSLHLVNLESGFADVQLTSPSNLKEPILSTVAWANDNVLDAIWMSRVQNEAYVLAYNVNAANVPQTVSYLTEVNGWLELFTPPVFSADGSKLLLILSQEQDKHVGAFKHLVMIENKERGAVQVLTKGKFVVTEVLGWDGYEDVIYYEASTEIDPAVRHVYSITLSTRTILCLTCSIKSTYSNSGCSFNSALFSPDSSHSIVECKGPGIPTTYIFKGAQPTTLWENNERLAGTLRTILTPRIQRYVFDVADGFKAHVLLQLPPNLDTSGNTKYPMLVSVYAGPNTQQVTDEFKLNWGSYLSANKSIIYAVIDGRGSGTKGDKYLFSLYRRLGTVEIIDQLNVTRQLQQTLPYIDPARTAIWGWSYGGYASGMALATDTEGVFKCGISVAPVTDWLLYDSIYTERFMGLPTPNDNLRGYKDASLLTKGEGLRGKQYFLIHGTLDDNVHYQQSMQWAKILEHEDILFNQLSYPDEHHGLDTVRFHLYHSLEKFLDDCFIREQ